MTNILTVENLQNLTILVGGLWGVVKFREYLKDKRFNNYHKLIDELVNENTKPGHVIKLDRQIAIVYELRNYTSYFPATKRILTGLKKDWINGDERIKNEIDETIKFISQYFFVRWYRIFTKN